MFNTFLAQKRENKLTRQTELVNNQQNWKKRYHTQVQPRLLQHYGKRLMSFMHKMDQHPFVMNPENLKKKKLDPVQHFTFKTVQDWKSVLTLRQRTQKIENQRFLTQKHNQIFHHYTKQTQLRKTSQQRQYEYRAREKLKQIHPPMKYTNKVVEGSTQPVKRKRYSLRQMKSKKKQQYRGPSKLEQTQINLRDNNLSVTTSSNRHYEENQEIDFNFVKHQKTENIQVQARKYEKEREIVQKKLHFKKLLDLSLTAPRDSQKNQIKDILRKCGYLKPKMINPNTESSEMDKFASIVQRSNK